MIFITKPKLITLAIVEVIAIIAMLILFQAVFSGRIKKLWHKPRRRKK